MPLVFSASITSTPWLMPLCNLSRSTYWYFCPLLPMLLNCFKKLQHELQKKTMNLHYMLNCTQNIALYNIFYSLTLNIPNIVYYCHLFQIVSNCHTIFSTVLLHQQFSLIYFAASLCFRIKYKIILRCAFTSTQKQ